MTRRTALAVSEPDGDDPNVVATASVGTGGEDSVWVSVTHKDFEDAEPGLVTREWLDGWGKDKGWKEVK